MMLDNKGLFEDHMKELPEVYSIGVPDGRTLTTITKEVELSSWQSLSWMRTGDDHPFSNPWLCIAKWVFKEEAFRDGSSLRQCYATRSLKRPVHVNQRPIHFTAQLFKALPSPP